METASFYPVVDTAAPFIQTKLEIPLTPDINIIPANMQRDFQNIYNALRTVAYALDSLSGNINRTVEDLKNLVTADPRNYIQAQNLSRIYVKFSQTASYGQIVCINSTGQAQLAVRGYGGDPRAAEFMPIGFVSEESVEAGNIGAISLYGIIGAGGVVVGETYVLSRFVAGSLSTYAGDLETLGIAIGITENTVYFHIPRSIYTLI